MKIDKENNKVYLNDLEKIEYQAFLGLAELLQAFIIGCIIGTIIEVIKFLISR